MQQRNRLRCGGLVDRSKQLSFSFDRKAYNGFAGDTLASALMANGVTLVGRSFKYHRPRGIYSAGVEEPNALVQLESGAHTVPNVPATQIELYDGLEARSQNNWPSLAFDIGAVADRFSRFISAGFYYKTFMRPATFWTKYEYVIRRAAGLGRCPTDADPDCYDECYAYCDVFVVGGGPAGLAAALSAARTGARVILADDRPRFGGMLLDADTLVDGKAPVDWLASLIGELERLENVRLLVRSTVIGYYDHNFLAAVERLTDHLPPSECDASTPRHRLWKVRAKQTILATGAFERPLIFADNDRPGVMLASAVLSYLNRFAVTPGRRFVVFTNNDTAYSTALALKAHGQDVAAVVDLRAEPNGPLPTALRDRGIQILPNSAIVGVNGRLRVRAVQVMQLNAAGNGVRGPAQDIACDCLCSSGGWNPAIHLFSQSGGRLKFDDELAAYLPDKSTQALRNAGSCQGSFALLSCINEGFSAGLGAARDSGFKTRSTGTLAPQVESTDCAPMRAIWSVPSGVAPAGHRRHFVDLQNDVTVADIHLAVLEGYESVEHCKRYTTIGMGPDQGKTANVNAIGVLAEARHMNIAEVGTTTFRPPYTPVAFSAIAGRNVGRFLKPVRKTPIHEWHQTHGAVFENTGLWTRARGYPRASESMDQTAIREASVVRRGVGLTDVSTLGKIEIVGSDAAEFLNRLYTNDMGGLQVGRCRYGLMLRETGRIFDDGVVVRLAAEHFLISTTTGHADDVFQWMEEWLQCYWADLQVYVTPVTEHWSQMAIAGPDARRAMAKVTGGVDLSDEAFPLLSTRSGTVDHCQARIFRISFSGELAFEIAVPSAFGVRVWESLMQAGREYDIVPYGLEALKLLRAEKGFILIGEDTDGTQMPPDMGMNWMVSDEKADFIGKRSLSLSDVTRPDREQFIGLLTHDPDYVLPVGTAIVHKVAHKTPMTVIGHVTAGYFSPALERAIALGLVQGGLSRLGQVVSLVHDDHTVLARVVSPRFFDPDGARSNG